MVYTSMKDLMSRINLNRSYHIRVSSYRQVLNDKPDQNYIRSRVYFQPRYPNDMTYACW